MGLRSTDITPLGSYGPTATTPANKDVQIKVFAINRTDTTASVKCVLPADATIVDFRIYSTAVSNAGTAATVSVGIPGTNTYFFGPTDVKTAANKINVAAMTNLFNLENTPNVGDISITGLYTESGTASTSGGPFYITVEYVR